MFHDLVLSSMIPKSGVRFSEKIMRTQKLVRSLTDSGGNLKVRMRTFGDRPCPAHAIDHRARVRGLGVAAPRHMAIRPHQHKPALVRCKHLRRIEVYNAAGYAALVGSRLQSFRRGRAPTEAQQHKATAIEVEGGASVGK